jgi:hypothetical protein
VAIFLPGALLVYASLPFWNMFREHLAFRRALSGINACMVGTPLAALYLMADGPSAIGRRRRVGRIRIADSLETSALPGGHTQCYRRGPAAWRPALTREAPVGVFGNRTRRAIL